MSAFEQRWSRRELVRRGGAMAMAWTMARSWSVAEAKVARTQESESDRPILNRFPRMVQEFHVDRVRAIMNERDRVLKSITSRADAERYVASVRRRIAESFGPLPERSPLNPRITGVIDRETYRIEKLIFESRPGFLVTANLYVPKGRSGTMPGVVGTCGHSTEGKAAEAYQGFAQGLARQGYVVLIYDPIGQGERLQYLGDDLESTVGPGVREHLMAGNQQFLVGEFIGTWRAWDGIRALDYLQTRDEVDPNHIGVTGNSGGGTMTTWLCGVERRWSMAAPSCFVTSFRRNLENELPADTEQCPPRALALGLDHGDFLAAMAPKPVIILAKERDYFDVRGSEKTYAQLKHLYQHLGAPERIELFVGPTSHGYSQENREAMYRWFNGVTEISDAQREPDLTIESVETLQCSPDGQVGAMGSKSVVAFTRERSRQLRRDRPKRSPDEVPAAVAEALRLPARPDSAPDYRILRPLTGRDYPRRFAGVYAVAVEPEIHAIVYRLYDQSHYSRPPGDVNRAILYVSDKSADAELREEPWIRELIASDDGAAFYALDVRGIGESRPETCGVNSYFTPYGSDYFYAAHGIMLDRPYPAQRTFDILTVLAWLRSIGHDNVHLASRGWGSIPSTFAAVLSDVVETVTLKHALTSYSDVAESERYDWPLSSLMADVLTTLDLPDCYRALEAKNLRLIEPKGATA